MGCAPYRKRDTSLDTPDYESDSDSDVDDMFSDAASDEEGDYVEDVRA